MTRIEAFFSSLCDVRCVLPLFAYSVQEREMEFNEIIKMDLTKEEPTKSIHHLSPPMRGF